MTMTRVEIDPNIRVRGDLTFVCAEDADGEVFVGREVEVFESESGLIGRGVIAEIDNQRQLIYLHVDWASLRVQAAQSDPVPCLVVHRELGERPGVLLFDAVCSLKVVTFPGRVSVGNSKAARLNVGSPSMLFHDDFGAVHDVFEVPEVHLPAPGVHV